MTAPANVVRPFLSRLALGAGSAFALVFAATVAVGGRGYDLRTLGLAAAVTAVIALIAGAIAAVFVRQDLKIAFVSQGLSLAAIALLNFWR